METIVTTKNNFYEELVNNEGKDITLYFANELCSAEQTLNNYRVSQDGDMITFADGIDNSFCKIKMPSQADIHRLVIHRDENGNTKAVAIKEKTGKELSICYID